MLKIKELHLTLKHQFSSFEFLSELKGLEVELSSPQQAYTAVHTRIKHLKKRFKVFEFFEKLRVGIYHNHNTLVATVTDEVLEAIGKSKALVLEFNSHLLKLNDTIAEVGHADLA